MADRPILKLRLPAPAPRERSGVIKRSLSIAGHATSISLEEPFWAELKALADRHGTSLAGLVAAIDGKRGRTNLSSALRVHVLECMQARASNTPDETAD
jgi:predicted DNA-binding ribbon-helix-helix protein